MRGVAVETESDRQLAAELVARAASMVPALRAREVAAIEAGQMPVETIKAFEDAGFFKILQPKRYGGYELAPLVYFQVARTLAEGCMSSAWVYAVIACHNWQLALFDDRAQRDVWGEDNAVRTSSSYMPVGKVTVVDGGCRLSGRWAFSSGSAHCQWVILGAHVPGDKPAPHNFLLPRSDYRIVDNWDVMGLRATGSNDILVEDAFVPDHRVIAEASLFDLQCPGHAVNTASLYKIPFAQIFNRAVSTTSLGSLKRAMDVFVDATRQRRTTYTGERLARDPSIQMAVCEVEHTLDHLTLVLERDSQELMRRAEDHDWPLEARARLGASTTTAVSRCVTEVDKLMQFSGGKAIYRSNPVQRAFLDIHCARAHVANNPFPYARNLGAMRFGFDNQSEDI